MEAIPCGIYVRISQDRRGAGQGVQRQEEACRVRAAELGWDVVEVYSDNDLSAFSGKRRPAYDRLLADISSGRIKGLLAWHPDRLHRRPIEQEHFITLVEEKKLLIQTITAGHYDLSTPTGRMIARNIGAFARMESEHKGERIAAARKQQAMDGRHHGGVRPFGFEKDGVTIRSDEAAEVVKAADSIIAGVSLRSIVRDLNLRGVPTASGRGTWTSTVLRAILISPRVAGKSSWHGEIVGDAVWPALVPEDRWRAVVAILTNPARRTSVGGPVKWLGSGLYICGVCGDRKLRVGAGTAGRRTYRCTNRNDEQTSGHVTREATSLDKYVEGVAVDFLSQAGVVRYLTTRPESATDVDALQARRAELEARLDELAAAHAAGAITARQLVVGSEMLKSELENLDGKLAAQVETGPFVDLVGISDISGLWFGSEQQAGLALGLRRTIVDHLMDVTVMPAPRGPAFRSEFVEISWKIEAPVER